MVFHTYPVELVNNIKSKGADLNVENGPEGTFKISFRSHFYDIKNIMTTQRWYKEKHVWYMPPPPEPTKWELKGFEFLKEIERRKDRSINPVPSIYDKLFDVSVEKNEDGTYEISHNIFKTPNPTKKGTM